VSRREAWVSAGAVFALALAVRIVAAAAISFPVPENTAYYAGVARNLAEGRGLISDALWSYQTQPLVVPRAAFEVWLPLPSLLAALPTLLAGSANWFRAAQVVPVLAGSAVAVLAWRIGADVAAEMQLPIGRARTLGIGTGLVAAALGPLVLYSALPDSTALFAAFSLGACLLMTRIAARESAPDRSGADRAGDAAGAAGTRAAVIVSVLDPQLLGLGLVLALAALTRSEAVWLGLAWAAIAWFWTPGSRRHRTLLIVAPAVVAALIYSPWAIRDWLVFGNPLPGQAITNALSLHDYDIFAYQDQPTLARFLGQGPVALAGIYLTGIAHDLFQVLVVPALPVSVVGLLALPWAGRRRALRPLLMASTITFVTTSLLFPVATVSGTYLHASGAAYVLLALGCLLAFDVLIVRIGRVRHWTRPVAWIGPACALAAILPLSVITVGGMARQADDVQNRYEALTAAMDRAGLPLSGAGPIITDNPIWLAEAARVPAIALPEESPEAVLAVARRFDAELLIVKSDGHGPWPEILGRGGPSAQCFKKVPLTDSSGGEPVESSPLAQMRVFRIDCP
jgi:nucleotide-binding universal stress UspA family protein